MQDRRTIIRTDGATRHGGRYRQQRWNRQRPHVAASQQRAGARRKWSVDRLTRVAPIVDDTNGVAALSQDNLNFVPATVHRARGGRSAATSGWLTQTISALVQSTCALVGGALKTCPMSLTWALDVGSLTCLDISGGGTLLAQTAATAGVETCENVSVVVRTAAATPKQTISIANTTKGIQFIQSNAGPC
jgi:hypothetical protein